MTTRRSCVHFSWQEATPPSPATAATATILMPSCTVELRIRLQYQLKFTRNGFTKVLDEVLTPEYITSHKFPIIFPLSLWRECFLSDDTFFKSLNLDANVSRYLRPKIAEAVISLAERLGKNIEVKIVVTLGVLREDFIDDNEVAKISDEFLEVTGLD